MSISLAVLENVIREAGSIAMTHFKDLKNLEAIFFVSGKFLNMQELITLTDLNPIILRDLIIILCKNMNK